MFQLITKKDTSVSKLKEYAHTGVILEMCIYPYEKTCQVSSYAYNYSGDLCAYQPRHVLSERGYNSNPTVEVSTGEMWRQRFNDQDTYIDIECEEFGYLIDEEEKNTFKSMFYGSGTLRCYYEIYFSDDHANFYGPLECNFMQWWLENHEDYHLEVYEQRGDFLVTNDVCLSGYYGMDENVVIPDYIQIINNLTPKSEYIKHVILPQGLKIIDTSAFKNCHLLESIEIPDSVEYIGFAAFENCSSLESIYLPKNLIYLPKYCFNNCSSLKNIHLSRGLKTIEANCFENCKALESIEFPSSVRTIQKDAFKNCQSLISLKVPKSLKEIMAYAFTNCINLSEIPISDKTHIKINAFYGCSEKIRELEPLFDIKNHRLLETSYLVGDDLIIPEGVETIERGGIYRKNSLHSLVFPSTFKGKLHYLPICQYVFFKSHEQVKIYDTIKQVDFIFFCGCNLYVDHEVWMIVKNSVVKHQTVFVGLSPDNLQFYNINMKSGEFLEDIRLNIDVQEDLDKLFSMIPEDDKEMIDNYVKEFLT